MKGTLMEMWIEVILASEYFLDRMLKIIIMQRNSIQVLMEIKCLQDFQIFSFKILFKKIIKYQAKEDEHFKVLIIFSIREQQVHRNIL